MTSRIPAPDVYRSAAPLAAAPGAAARGSSSAAIARLLASSAATPALDRIAQLAAQLLRADSGQSSLFDGDTMTVTGRAGPLSGPLGVRLARSESICTLVAARGEPVVIPDASRDAWAATLGSVQAGLIGAYLGVPVRDGDGEVVGALCVVEHERRDWSSDDVTVLEHLSESVRCELELAARIDGAGEHPDDAPPGGPTDRVGSFDHDLRTGELKLDEQLAQLYGFGREPRPDLAAVDARIHPDDRERVAAASKRAIDTVGTVHARYRVVLPDGQIRWLQQRGQALAGADGTAVRLLGLGWDVTHAQQNAARAERVLAGMTVGYMSLNSDWQVVYVNDEAARILGYGAEVLIGANIFDGPTTRDSEYGACYRRVAATGCPETLEGYYPPPLNAWYEVRVMPEPDGIAVYFVDVTEQRQNAQLLHLSVEVSERMVGAVSVEDAVSALTRMVVPDLADWTMVSLVDEHSLARDVHTWHADPAKRSLVASYSGHRLQGGGGTGAANQARLTAQPFRIDSDALAWGLPRLASDEAKRDLVELGIESAVVVPMLGGDNSVVGLLTLCRGPDRPAMDEQELAVTVTLCRRAGLAIDNARLQAAQAARAEHDRTVAESLQRAMLTRLPAAPHLQLAARYLTAADGHQVGGDWYDALVHRDGSTTVMIGDVVGHDISAAATMGQLRTMLRMVAIRDGRPSTMLRRLDDAAHELRLTTLATAVVARIEAGQHPATGRVVRWSSAGHPPPLVVRPDGTTTLLEADRADIIIGVRPERERHDHVVPLPVGSTLLLYTDGLAETRTDSIDEGIARVRAALARHHGLDPETLLDRVLADTVGDSPEDDVAVLAVRILA